MLKLDLMQTLAFAAVVLYLGYSLRRLVPVLGRYNFPAPVIGGLLVSLLSLLARQWNVSLFEFDTTLRDPLMVAFFTSIGFGASISLLRRGGPLVIVLLVICTVVGALQNAIGAGLAVAMGQSPLFGVLCGSVTMMGGPGTSRAWADKFQAAGIVGADAIAAAAAIGGIVMAGVAGTPVGTLLIERMRRKELPNREASAGSIPVAAQIVEAYLPESSERPPAGEDAESYSLIKSIGWLLVAMWIGQWVSAGLTAIGIDMAPQIGPMIVAAVLRNVDDLTGWLGFSQAALDDLGNTALAFFLVIALMTLELWKLAAVAVPLVVILLVQLVVVLLLSCWPVFPRMGRDYEAAVISSGFIGFMVGITANAMANMESLVRRYGPAPRAFLVVPMVGAFFIDFTNNLMIQVCLAWLR